MAPSFLTIQQFAQRHPAFSEASLRWLRFKCETNGFDRAFVTVGRRVLVDEDEFFKAVDRLNAREEEGEAA